MKRIACLIALIVLMACPLWAADVKISELPVVTETTPATDVVPVNASGVTSQITVANLLAGKSYIPIAAGGGDVDAITADYTPNVTLADRTTVMFVSLGPNTTTTPTFAPDGLTARVIKKEGGSALVAGDILDEGAVHILVYDLTNTCWELLNPGKPGILANYAPSSTLTAGADASKGNCTDGAAFYYGTDTHILYHCSATNTWTQVYGVGADGSYQMTITNNTAISPTASANQLYPEANVWKAVQNGTENSVCIGPTGGQVTFTGPTQARSYALPDAGSLTLATLTGTETLTNKTITAPITTLPHVDGGAADVVLSAAQVSGTVIRNTGQAVNDRNHTLPQAAEGYNFIGFVGEAQAAKYFRFTADASPQDYMCLDGTCGKTYVSIAAPTQGAMITCYTAQMASTGINASAALATGSTTDKVANGAFTFDVAGTGYTKAADAVGTEMDAATTPQNKYGAQALDIGADGTIDATPGTNIATGFDTAGEAVTDLPAVEAAHVRIGYATAMRTNAAGFVWGTTGFDDAETTEAFTSTAAYTKPYGWICSKAAGTWVTD